ncbi:MAG: four-carbon acid sugar kinase family protein [Deltaproteobacteria bacterium]|nr:four-carbon acid sugar kinase family protein [Deltaproteobacteria bacterium]MBW2150584.1 four-carbon acid sugar kinase family protein [Deltaproteobacteria bacterium]
MDRKMLKFMVVADDLSGACDTVVQFKRFGYSALVLNKTDNAEKYLDRYEAMAVTTNSRDLTPAAARKAVKQVCRFLKRIRPKTIYKKIDSTWRGNIGAELEVMIKELQVDFALVCSAYPENKRLALGGYLLVDGKLLHHTAMARDPASPIRKGYLPDLLADQTELPVFHLSLKLIEKGHDSVASFITEGIKKGPCLILADATEESHLNTIACLKSELFPSFFLAGSAGLSAAFLRCQRQESEGPSLPILIVAGSVNPKSISQVDRLLKMENVKELYMPWQMLLDSRAGHLQKLVSQGIDILSKGTDLVIRTCRSADEAEAAKAQGKRTGRKGAEIATVISEGLQQCAGGILRQVKVSGMMVTGGTTAVKLLEAVGAEGIEVNQEIEPGVPLGQIVGGELSGTKILTKAGGFGSPEVFQAGIEAMKQNH